MLDVKNFPQFGKVQEKSLITMCGILVDRSKVEQASERRKGNSVAGTTATRECS
jgi:hypothetical protein